MLSEHLLAGDENAFEDALDALHMDQAPLFHMDAEGEPFASIMGERYYLTNRAKTTGYFRAYPQDDVS